MSYEGKVKSSSLAYNQRETQDKWSLGRDRQEICVTAILLSMIKLF